MPENAPSPRPTDRSSTSPGGRDLTRRSTGRLLAALTVAGAVGAGTATPTAASGNRRPHQATSPFTGLPAEPAPVLAVKIDNHQDARPHTALEHADIVGVEKVEGGLGRLFAVFCSNLPDSLGPVRSAREYNVEQLRMFNRPALAYSGARKEVVDLIAKSPLYGVSHDDHPEVYFRGGDNKPPHNLYARPDEVLGEAPDASDSADVGFRFGNRPKGGKPTKERTVDYGSAQTTFSWSAKEKRWLVSFDGKPAKSTSGERLGGNTVVIQQTDMPPDSSGSTPYIKTVGRGTATILRDGAAFETTWERPKAESGTTFTLPNGERMPFARGQVWLVYEER